MKFKLVKISMKFVRSKLIWPVQRIHSILTLSWNQATSHYNQKVK